jgi:biopolymer transport protein ExbB
MAERHSRHLLDRALALGRAGRIEEAVELTERTPGPVAAVLHAGLRRYRDRFEIGEIEAALTTTGVVELGFLERGLVVLATVSNVAPLLGFLCTVAGMISAFGASAPRPARWKRDSWRAGSRWR